MNEFDCAPGVRLKIYLCNTSQESKWVKIKVSSQEYYHYYCYYYLSFDFLFFTNLRLCEEFSQNELTSITFI